MVHIGVVYVDNALKMQNTSFCFALPHWSCGICSLIYPHTSLIAWQLYTGCLAQLVGDGLATQGLEHTYPHMLGHFVSQKPYYIL